MITEAQRLLRKQGIFSSDVSRIVDDCDGVRVALEKLGHIEEYDFTGNREIEVGAKGEALILDSYEKLTGTALERSPDTIWHPELVDGAGSPWMGCHLDARPVEKSKRLIVESKAIGWYNNKEWGEGGDQVPDRVLWQVQEQMDCAGVDEAHIPVCFVSEDTLKDLFLERPPEIIVYRVQRSFKLVTFLVEECRYVWACIRAGMTPEAAKPSDARLLYRKDNGGIIEADDDALAIYRQMIKARDTRLSSEKEEKNLKDMLRLYMKENAELRYLGRTLATNVLNTGRAGYTVEPTEPFRTLLPKVVKSLLQEEAA